MSSFLDDPIRDEALRKWVSKISGARIANIQRVSGGAFRRSCRVELEEPDGAPGSMFLKIDLGSAPPTPFDLPREHALLAKLDGRARAPRALGYEPDLQAMAMECLSGDANYAAITDDAHRALVEQSFVDAMVEGHRVDVASLALDHLPPGLSIGEAVRTDLALWRDLLTLGVADPDDITLFALAWCVARCPHDERPAALIQGDAGPGNFLFDVHGVTGVVDWEMTHLGHPLEDLGCVLARSLMQPLASAERLLDLYRASSGVDWSREELLYSTILVMARFSVPISLALESQNSRLDYGLVNSYFRLSQISLLRLIAVAEGIVLDETVREDRAPPPVGFEFEYLRSVLEENVKPALTEPYALYRLEGAIRLLDYLDAALSTPAASAGRPNIGMAGSSQQEMLIEKGGADMREAMQTMYGTALHREKLMQSMLGPLYGRRITV